MSSRTQSFTISDTIHVAPSHVYRFFTDADAWCMWCVEEAQIDPRAGGKLHIYTEGYHAYGKFKELEPDKTVIFTWDGDNEPPTLIKVSLQEETGDTIINFQVNGLGSEEAWNVFADELEKIWTHALRNLKRVLEDKQKE